MTAPRSLGELADAMGERARESTRRAARLRASDYSSLAGPHEVASAMWRECESMVRSFAASSAGEGRGLREAVELAPDERMMLRGYFADAADEARASLSAPPDPPGRWVELAVSFEANAAAAQDRASKMRHAGHHTGASVARGHAEAMYVAAREVRALAESVPAAARCGATMTSEHDGEPMDLACEDSAGHDGLHSTGHLSWPVPAPPPGLREAAAELANVCRYRFIDRPARDLDRADWIAMRRAMDGVESALSAPPPDSGRHDGCEDLAMLVQTLAVRLRPDDLARIKAVDYLRRFGLLSDLPSTPPPAPAPPPQEIP